MFPFSSDETYRMDTKVDGEVVGLEILDTVSQVRHQVHMSEYYICSLFEPESVTQLTALPFVQH